MFWYVVIAILVVLAIAMFAVYVPEHTLPNKQWGAFIFFTFFLFLFLTKFYWGVRKPHIFWAFFLGLLVAHVLIYAPILRYIQRAFWYLFIMPLETMLLVLVIKLVFDIMPTPKTRL